MAEVAAAHWRTHRDTLAGEMSDDEALGGEGGEAQTPADPPITAPVVLANATAGRGLRVVANIEHPSAGNEDAATATTDDPEAQEQGEMGDDSLGQGQAAPEAVGAPDPEPQRFAWERERAPAPHAPEPRKRFAWE